MIELRGIRHGILDIPALDIVPGSTVVIGPNGSGKTTLLKIFAGLAEPESGTVSVDGMPLSSVDIGWVDEYPDKNMLFGRVSDEIAAPLRFLGVPCPAVRSRVHAISDQLGITSLLDRNTRDLSGGEKVLASLATALITGPLILVLDEADSHLDEYSTRLFMTIPAGPVPKYRLWCTQDMELAARSDTVLLLEQGKITHFGPPDTVFPDLLGSCLYPFSWRCADEKPLL
ncbi:MAG TPA: energy-coupling factor ABC transporter ATP-binding protein [Methanoregulaceae archaeon]|nr:energy-coupling factor ABC transporter ATP-binding protein [Methanoregulaceae archaeon]